MEDDEGQTGEFHLESILEHIFKNHDDRGLRRLFAWGILSRSANVRVEIQGQYLSLLSHWLRFTNESERSFRVSKVLLGYGAQVDESEEIEHNLGLYPPLSWAIVEWKSVEVVKVLIKADANVHQRGSYLAYRRRHTPLRTAVEFLHGSLSPLDIIKILVQHGADLYTTWDDDNEMPPGTNLLHIAARDQCHREEIVVRYLLSKGLAILLITIEAVSLRVASRKQLVSMDQSPNLVESVPHCSMITRSSSGRSESLKGYGDDSFCCHGSMTRARRSKALMG